MYHDQYIIFFSKLDLSFIFIINADSKVDSSLDILYWMNLIITGVWNQMWIIIVILVMMCSNSCVIMAKNMVTFSSFIFSKCG